MYLIITQDVLVDYVLFEKTLEKKYINIIEKKIIAF